MTLSSAPRRAHDREVHMSFVEFHDVSKVYTMGTNKIYAANGVDFTIEKGEFCVPPTASISPLKRANSASSSAPAAPARPPF